MAAVAVLDLFYAILDHPRKAIASLCHCAKFGCIRCSTFDDKNSGGDAVAQRVERWTCDQQVVGSNPTPAKAA